MNRLKWLKTGISTCIYKRCGLQKGRAARRKTLHSHPALYVVNPRITKNFSTPINYRQISLPIELHLAPNILGSKKEKTPRPCEAQNHDDMERLIMSVSNSLPFFIWLAAYEIMGNFSIKNECDIFLGLLLLNCYLDKPNFGSPTIFFYISFALW